MDALRGVAGRRAGEPAGWERAAGRRPVVAAPGAWRMSGWHRHRGAGGQGSGRAGVRGLAGGLAVCLVAAAALVLGGVAAPNGSSAQRHQRGGHQRGRVLAAALASGAWTGYSGRWSGYMIGAAAHNEVAATFTVPALSCQSGEDGPATAFWAGISSTDSNGTQTIVQDGVRVACANGQPQYYAWIVSDVNTGYSVPLPNPVQPGDTVTAAVWEMGATYWMGLYDPVENWWSFNSITGVAASTNIAAVAAESFNGGAYFDPVAVTGAEVNGVPLGQSNPVAEEEDPGWYNGTAGLDPSGLDASGQNFNFYWNGTPAMVASPGLWSSGSFS